MKYIKKIFVVMAIATLIISFGLATAHATTDIKNEKKDTGISIESKEKKVSSFKVTWNYNGGKIGNKKSKVTTVKKGSKIGKFVATPKRSEYTFKGWYTKKNGGKKVSRNTKVTKKVTFFAQWKKKSTTSSTGPNQKLVGHWRRHDFDISGDYDYYHFFLNKDGTFNYYLVTTAEYSYKGKYSVSNGKIYMKNVVFTNGDYKANEPDSNIDYKFEFDSKGKEWLKISNTANSFMGATSWYRA